MLADAFDRKKLLMILTVEQAVLLRSCSPWCRSTTPTRRRSRSFVVTLLIGIGNALYAPVFSAVLPVLVPRRDLAGAISLNSVQMNASRVIGPVDRRVHLRQLRRQLGVRAQRR